MHQELSLNILKSGRNVFLTGQAGSGKTFVINQYIKWLWACDIPVAITASTGIAATHIGGVTIHSRSGIGIKDKLTDHDLDLLQQKQHLHKNINKAKVLIIDEVSMISAITLDMIDRVTQMMRRDGRPFGGLQVVLIGDFFQLPPVISFNADLTQSNKRFAFASKAWKDLDLAMCYLHTQHRQGEGDFRTILNELRKGEISDTSLTLLNTRMHQDIAHPNPVKLYTHNIDVDRINSEKLDELDEEEMSYVATGSGDPKLIVSIKKSMLAPEVLYVKIGAQVIFVKNNPAKGYYNGTTGQVIGFDPTKKHPLVKIQSGEIIKAEPETRSIENASEILVSVSQVPLKLARAITVHKSQGMTLDAAEIDLSKVFEPGQAYVALSRVRSLESLKLLGLNEEGLSAHPLVSRGDRYFWEQSEGFVQQHNSRDDEMFEKVHRYFVKALGGNYVVESVLVEKTLIEKKIRPRKPKEEKGDTLKITLALVEAGKTLEEIVKERGLTESTILQHIFNIHILHPNVSLKKFRPDASLLTLVKAVHKKAIKQGAIDEEGKVKLKALFERLNGAISYQDIKRCLIFI